MVLCDITSSYVVGEHSELAAYGYNRGHKQGKKQNVLGLLTDPEGCPVATEVFTGNTADPTTVAVQVNKLQQAFKLESVSLKVRPIHHRRKNRVIGHVFLCMLAYYVEYHLRQALAPMLLSEDDHAGKANQRESEIAPAKQSKQAEQKVRTQRTSDGDRAMSYSALMVHLSGVCRHVVESKFAAGEPNRFVMMSELTPTQQRAFKLLNVKVQ